MSFLRLSLGGLAFDIAAQEEILLPEGDAYRGFFHSGDRVAVPDTVEVPLVVTASPRADGRPIFESDATWGILAQGARRTLVDRDASGPFLAVHFEPGSAEVRVECSPAWRVHGGSRIHCPLRYPVDQVLAMFLLGRQGLVLHAAGGQTGGKAVVLPGVSGAGKTTFCRLAEGREGWIPLSDDRVIVRLPDSGGAVAHGTPWPGEGRIAADSCAPLERLVFLAQGPENGLKPLAPGQALQRLLAAASIPWYDADYLGPALEACDRLVGRVPAFVLTFRPDQEAVGLVERLLEEELPSPDRG